jgi:hypothetical protein
MGAGDRWAHVRRDGKTEGCEAWTFTPSADELPDQVAREVDEQGGERDQLGGAGHDPAFGSHGRSPCLGDQAGEAGDEHVAADAGRAPLQAARQEDDEEGADPTPPG